MGFLQVSLIHQKRTLKMKYKNSMKMKYKNEHVKVCNKQNKFTRQQKTIDT